MPTVNMEVLEESRRHQVVQKYEVYPLNTADVKNYQIKTTGMASSIKEDARIIQYGLQLDQWVELKSSVWSKLNNLKAKTPLVIFGLSGNPSSNDIDDGDATFDFFDDFTDEVLSFSWANISTDVYANGVYTPQYPPGIYVASQDKTYIVWQTLNLGRNIIEYDHSTKTFQNETVIGGTALVGDGHGGPALVVDGTGYLYVFYGSHGSTQYYKKSSNIYDITSWGAEQSIAGVLTYPNLWFTDSKLWYIYRVGTVVPVAEGDIAYRTSVDGGSNWSAETKVTEFGADSSAYFRTINDSNGDIHVTWLCRENDPSITYNNIYYAKYNISSGHWEKRDGTQLTLPINSVNADKIFNGNDTWLWGLDVDASNNPYILFAYSGDNKIKLAKWVSSSWNTYDAVDYAFAASNSYGLLKVDDSTNMRIVMDSTDHKTAKLYNSTDGGENWVFEKIIGEEVSGAAYNIGNYQTIYNANGDLEFLFGPGVHPGSGGRVVAWGKDSNFTHDENIDYSLTEKWAIIAGTPTILNDKLYLDNDERINTKTWTGNTISVRAKTTLPNETGSTVYSLLGLYDNVNQECSFLTYYGWEVRSKTGVGFEERTVISAYNGEHTFELKKNAGTSAKYYLDDVLEDTDTAHIPNASIPIFLHKSGANDLLIDWVFAHKYTSNEPVIQNISKLNRASLIKALGSRL